MDDTHDTRDAAAIPRHVRGSASWQVGRAARRGRGLLRTQLAQFDLGLLDYLVLATLAESGPRSQAMLVRMLPIDGSDMVAVLAKLEGMGLVVRRVDPADARRKLVEPTPLARRRQARLDNCLSRADVVLLAPLDAGERREFIRLLKKLAGA